jgi:hypothetical protein
MEIAEPPSRVTDCNCSICRRLGTLWAYYRPDQVAFVSAADATFFYSWGDRELEFHHCRTCGCTTHWQSADKTDPKRMGVNSRLFDPGILEGVPVRKFDGAAM